MSSGDSRRVIVLRIAFRAHPADDKTAIQCADARPVCGLARLRERFVSNRLAQKPLVEHNSAREPV
jgi:hypothetical protein